MKKTAKKKTSGKHTTPRRWLPLSVEQWAALDLHAQNTGSHWSEIVRQTLRKIITVTLLALVLAGCAAQTQPEPPPPDCYAPGATGLVLVQIPTGSPDIPGCSLLPEYVANGVTQHTYCCRAEDAPVVQ